MEIISVIVVRTMDGLSVESVESFNDPEVAESAYLDQCKCWVTNFDDYSSEDINAILDDGYCEFGNGVICIVHSSISVPEDLINSLKMGIDLLESIPHTNGDLDAQINDVLESINGTYYKYINAERSEPQIGPMANILAGRLQQLRQNMIDEDQFVYWVMCDMKEKGVDPDKIFEK